MGYLSVRTEKLYRRFREGRAHELALRQGLIARATNQAGLKLHSLVADVYEQAQRLVDAVKVLSV